MTSEPWTRKIKTNKFRNKNPNVSNWNYTTFFEQFPFECFYIREEWFVLAIWRRNVIRLVDRNQILSFWLWNVRNMKLYLSIWYFLNWMTIFHWFSTRFTMFGKTTVFYKTRYKKPFAITHKSFKQSSCIKPKIFMRFVKYKIQTAWIRFARKT